MMSLEHSLDERNILLNTAASSIHFGFVERRPLEVDLLKHPPRLQEFRNTFVTLYVRGEFQGCIGSMRAHTPLVQDVAKNAFSAAFQDRRGAPMSPTDLPDLKISISILSAPEPIQFLDEAELISRVRPGIDGLIVEEQGRHGTLLPSVWENIPDPGDFVRHVKLKAGLPSSYWSSSIRYMRYRTEYFSN
jgi:AmmeMemoRadiSam system protein A